MTDRGKRALFLDRDGVINVEKNYVHRRESFEFVDGIFELCQAAQARGYTIVVVTNQAGIARGYYSEEDFHELTAWMIKAFAEHEVEIARVYFCPYHPVHGVGRYKKDHPDRKPKPGMLLRAQTDLDLDMASSMLVGDQMSDIAAANAAGAGTAILLASSKTDLTQVQPPPHIGYSLDEIRRKYFSPREQCTSPLNESTAIQPAEATGLRT